MLLQGVCRILRTGGQYAATGCLSNTAYRWTVCCYRVSVCPTPRTGGQYAATGCQSNKQFSCSTDRVAAAATQTIHLLTQFPSHNADGQPTMHIMQRVVIIIGRRLTSRHNYRRSTRPGRSLQLFRGSGSPQHCSTTLLL